jgi:hypothetical protein
MTCRFMQQLQWYTKGHVGSLPLSLLALGPSQKSILLMV